MVRSAREPSGRQAGAGLIRLRLVCRGVVQGVGFRPTVHRLASGLGLAGSVANGPDGVVIEVEGPADAVERFADGLPHELPPLARIDALERRALDPIGERGFRVLASDRGRRSHALVPPDTALCGDCRREMEDAGDRRYRYPFTTCTNCGPRFSLVRELPYDRERTSMACFPLCPDCRREYEDPGDRRFHAEPVCCPVCGPTVRLLAGDGSAAAEGDDALRRARTALGDGAVVAVKGLGGFQLACRADADAAVSVLRERKRRPTKPFAVMVRDLDAARRIVALDDAAVAALTSPRAPVVLAPAVDGGGPAAGVAPGLGDVGVMLPTTPLHVELFRDAPFDALVMTSGNLSDEPICRGNREAVERLHAVADLFLVHDRDVVRRVDDSVVRTDAAGTFAVRRARGWVPGDLPLPEPCSAPVLALGGFLQVAACLAVGGRAFPSQHVGDLDSEPARAFLEEVVAGLEAFLQAEGEVVVVDDHPDYPSRWLGERLAAERGGRLMSVQHHVAHAAAVLAEHGRFPVIGDRVAAVSLDGTGFGADGTAWGGEWIVLGGDLGWRRAAHLEPVPLVGGEAAVREPWRVAVAALEQAGAGALAAATPMADAVSSDTLAAVARLSAYAVWPRASGAGRLFEAAGALLGLACRNGYEGEAAARLEAAAARSDEAAPWPEVTLGAGTVLPGPALLAAAARRAADGEPAARVAADFHATFCALAADLTARAVPAGVTAVALGGGCLVNRLLRAGLAGALAARGFEPLLPVQAPPGDGGLSYGQVVLGTVAAARGTAPRQEGGS